MTKKRRYLLCAGFLAVCVCVVLAVLATLPPRPGVTKANFDQIEMGMTEAEVDAIFARHLANSSRRKFARRGLAGSGKLYKVWGDVNGGGIVIFDDNGRVDRMKWNDHAPTPIENVRYWLRIPQ